MFKSPCRVSVPIITVYPNPYSNLNLALLEFISTIC
jgi:hypothetical protein